MPLTLGNEPRTQSWARIPVSKLNLLSLDMSNGDQT
jgi:hypothetical protein